MKKDPGKVLIGVDMVQLQDHVDTLKNLDKSGVLKWDYTISKRRGKATKTCSITICGI